ncbi:hypothetical protein Tsubulata_032521 [Turnera subulata]|uniref:Uncharacterized protein n=1 Tax=Turnera subulata TaxID=218843 RepID=A0A9Q0FV02_9ROSI|nr:hypothetical protein Tsubulata_032521 [Turnera subulata]
MGSLSVATTLKLSLFSFSSSSSSSSSSTTTTTTKPLLQNPFPSLSFPLRKAPVLFCQATKSSTKSSTGPPKKRSSSSSSPSPSPPPPSSSSSASKKKKKKKKKKLTLEDFGLGDLKDFEVVESANAGAPSDFHYEDQEEEDEDGGDEGFSLSRSNRGLTDPSAPLPKPPAGFVVDDSGRVLMSSTKRIATLVDVANDNKPLECVIRRVFRSSRGDECLLLSPVDAPIRIFKSVNVVGWEEVSDEEFKAVLPSVEYALAKRHMHLVLSGLCYTVRGGFCYSEDEIMDFRTDEGGEDMGEFPSGVEITSFNVDGSHYMIYTPVDAILFVAVKDQNGGLQLADDDLLQDPATASAIKEENDFNELVEEEAALMDSLVEGVE